jgi:type VI secretion system protein ImpI
MALKLILQVSNSQKLEIGDPRRVVFGAAGGRIGRGLDCDWVLSSRYVSRHHATIRCVGGVFYIESLGDNGVALNDAQKMLSKRERRALNNGDRLFLDEFEISVTILDTDAARQLGQTASPRALAPVVSLPVKESGSNERTPVADSGEAGSKNNIEDYPASLPTVLPLAPVEGYALFPVERDADVSTPTAPVATRARARADADLAELLALQEPVLADLSSVSLEQSVAITALPVRTSPATVAFDVSGFLSGAGIDPADVSPDTAYILGQIVRVSIQAAIDLLGVRAQFRNEFRLPITAVRASRNNPLKSVADAEEALAMLLRPGFQGRLPPLQAVVDAFDDIRFHQMALVTGMRAGFDGVTRRFDPKRLTEQFARSGRGSVTRLGSKARFWAEYVDMFENVAAYPDTAFQRLFRDEFGDAYQRHLDELRRNSNLASPPQAVHPVPPVGASYNGAAQA